MYLVRLSFTPNNTAIIIWVQENGNLNNELIFSHYYAIDEVSMQKYFI